MATFPSHTTILTNSFSSSIALIYYMVSPLNFGFIGNPKFSILIDQQPLENQSYFNKSALGSLVREAKKSSKVFDADVVVQPKSLTEMTHRFFSALLSQSAISLRSGPTRNDLTGAKLTQIPILVGEVFFRTSQARRLLETGQLELAKAMKKEPDIFDLPRIQYLYENLTIGQVFNGLLSKGPQSSQWTTTPKEIATILGGPSSTDHIYNFLLITGLMMAGHAYHRAPVNIKSELAILQDEFPQIFTDEYRHFLTDPNEIVCGRLVEYIQRDKEEIQKALNTEYIHGVHPRYTKQVAEFCTVMAMLGNSDPLSLFTNKK